MPELSHIDLGSAALLVLDYQIDALTKFMTAAQSADAITYVVDLISTARDAGMIVIHVVVARRPGHPEVSPRNPLFSVLKSNGMAVAEERRRRDPSGRCGSRGGTDRGQQRDATGVDTGAHQRVDAVARSKVSRSVSSNGLVRQASDLDYRLVVAGIAAPTQIQKFMQCCSTSSPRNRRPSSPRRSSPAPCLADLHERSRAIDLEKRRHSLFLCYEHSLFLCSAL